MAYESELEELLLRESERLFGLSRERLLPYLFRRSQIVTMKGLVPPEVTKSEIPSFFMSVWLGELAIPVRGGVFVYKGSEISVSVVTGEPLRNVYDNFVHAFEMYSASKGGVVDGASEWERAREDVRGWIRLSKRKSQKYRGKRVYPFLVKKRVLDLLNSAYQAEVSSPRVIPHIRYEEIPLKIMDEEVCEREILAFSETVEDPELLSEDELEAYVVRNLGAIEEGLRFSHRQFQLPRGRIDVLARDKEDGYVVIELKTEKDTDIIWQKWYYTEEVKKRFGTEHVRFMAIMPADYPEITAPLLEGSTPCDVFVFRPVIRRGRLVRVDFERVRSSSFGHIGTKTQRQKG